MPAGKCRTVNEGRRAAGDTARQGEPAGESRTPDRLGVDARGGGEDRADAGVAQHVDRHWSRGGYRWLRKRRAMGFPCSTARRYACSAAPWSFCTPSPWWLGVGEVEEPSDVALVGRQSE